MNAFDVLGVAPGATVEEIKAAFRRQAHHLHPDKQAGASAAAVQAANASFIQLHQAFRTALAEADSCRHAKARRAYVPSARSAASSATGPRAAQVPGQRVAPAFIPTQARPAAAAAPASRHDDPMLVLLTLPQVAGDGWEKQELSHWALTLVPAARPHLAEARRIAEIAGPITGADRALATAHVLLTLALSTGANRRGVLSGRSVAAAYDALDERLPATVRAGLPARATLLPRQHAFSWR